MEVNRTLKFLRNKAKNASANRVWIVQSAVNGFATRHHEIFDANSDASQVEAYMEEWYGILQDGLEDQNIGISASVPLPQNSFAFQILTLVTQSLNLYNLWGKAREDFFHFAVELHWRITEFQLGSKKCSLEWAPPSTLWTSLTNVCP